MKLKHKIFTFIAISLAISPIANSANIENIEVENDQNVGLFFSPEVFLDSEFGFDGDLKVLKDIEISFSSKDFEDSNKVILSLGEELKPNTSYSLISIFGAEGSIEFDLEEQIIGFEKNQEVAEDGIVKIVVTDELNIELTFKNELLSEDFEFKLLRQVNLEEISVTSQNSVNVKTEGFLENLSEYILIVVSMRDATGENITFEEDLYNFSTGLDLLPAAGVGNIFADDLEGDIEKELGDKALNAGETPDTGAETWVLIALTLFAQAGFIIRKKVLSNK